MRTGPPCRAAPRRRSVASPPVVGNDDGSRGDETEAPASATGDPALAAIDELLAAERWDEALRALGPLRRTRPKDPEVWKRQGKALQGDGHFSEAKVAALLWIELEPESVEAHRFAADLDDQKEREARQRAEENRWAAEMRLAALPPSVLEQEAERGGVPLTPPSRKEKRKRKRSKKRKDK